MTPAFRAVMLGVCLVLVLAWLAGCAGVVMNDAERAVCAAQGCSAYTEAEFIDNMGHAFKEGYQEGWRDFARQTGRSL